MRKSTTLHQEPKSPRAQSFGTRFYLHTKDALTYSWLNLLLVFVPVGIIVNELHVNPSVIFAINAVAIIPLAGLLSHATESVASKLGDTLGALLNVSFGNAVELIIFIALVKNEIRIVQASLLGSILSNLLLILGMAFLLGGLRFREQIYNSTVTQMSACLLSLSVTSLLLPTAFHASFADSADADDKVLKVSRGTSVVLLVVYILYLLFQLKSHAYMYESTPQQVIDEESYPGILADVFDSSSSSDGSGSSSSSDTDTSGSHTTTKRIKRAFRNRRRRKSSVSSTNTPSIPSTVSSPSQERPGHVWESQTTPPLRIPVPRRGSVLGMITSGDEADTDGEFDRDGTEPRIRDFGGKTDNASTAAPKERRQKNKPKKKHHRHHKRHSHADKFGKSEDPDEGSSIRGPGKEVLKEPSQSKVGFSDEVQVGAAAEQSQKHVSASVAKNVIKQRLRHSSTPSSSPALGGPPMMPRKIDGLRRTNSLPDRLNRQGTPANAQRSAVPPYPRGIAEAEDIPDEEDEEENKPPMSKTAATVLLLISTALVAVCAEFLVDAIPAMIDSTPVSQAFIGLIILPIVSNAAEHVTAVTVAAKNKMDLAIGVSVGSSIQIALFVTPLVVLLGWILDRDMSLYFNLFETISLFVTAFVVNFLVLDGRSNYLEGSLLIAAYVIIA
ncbi:hypothetical protein H2203_000197 [Taxawa tesnikishii (nom. ined.)]|nr:hypothetical protein H2203_000197 [Dothideales sp. JES 119]